MKFYYPVNPKHKYQPAIEVQTQPVTRCVSSPSFHKPLFSGALPGLCDGRVSHVTRQGGWERRMSKGRGDMKIQGKEGRENEWRDIFTCVVTGPKFPLGASAVGAAAVLCFVNSNATHTHTRRDATGLQRGIQHCAAA